VTDVAVIGESALLDGCDKLVVSSAHGRLTVVAPSSYTSEGEVVRAGHVLARIDADGSIVEVASPCDAWVMEFLVLDGARVEPGTAIVHLRAL
jgi:biotin carboxyl carrier protein